MDRTLQHCLIQLGCNDKQVRLYEAALTVGLATLPEIAKQARLQRSTAYLIAGELQAKGLLSEDHKSYRKLYSATEPATLLRMLAAQERRLGRTRRAFAEKLPEIQAIHQATRTRPRVRTFEGQSGLKAIMQDILAEQQELLLWTNQAAEHSIFDPLLHKSFITARIARNIPVRVLAVNNEEGAALATEDAACLRTTRLLPRRVDFTSETYIYGNKTAILDINRTIFGVITESQQIADSQRAIFELAWNRSGDNGSTV